MNVPAWPRILPARLEDAEAMLAMQLVAFEPEALACGLREIPPLQETVATIREHIRTAAVLKAVDGERLLGSIRGIVTGGSCLVRVLVVAPDAQGRGVGAMLLRSLEDAHPQVERFELNTNMAMPANVRFYLRHGYELVEEIRPSPQIRLAFMRKIARR